MTETPERIWAFTPDIFDNMSLWQDAPSPNGDTIEYIRADLHEALQAENERLREALAFYAWENEPRLPSEGPWGTNSTDFGKIASAALKETRGGFPCQNPDKDTHR